MSDAGKIADRLEDYLDSGYFSGAIENVYVMINHIHFLEQQVASLKDTIARMQSDTEEERERDGRQSRSPSRPLPAGCRLRRQPASRDGREDRHG